MKTNLNSSATLSPLAISPKASVRASGSASRSARLARAFFGTPDDATGIVLRLGLAIAMFPHGAQKALGWWGGWGFSNTVAAFTGNGMPLPLALAVIAAEFLGPIALVAGFFTRWSGFGIGLVMTGAAFMAHLQHGFFMNWMGTQKGEGVEYFILAVALAAALMIKGGGKWSVDRLIARRLDRAYGAGNGKDE